uniref:G_PROTEIN_RECEP_F1_2 domain-containing protein n=1 Tax=Heterorhabditis bacteriophora TaxID=37862 RepID=A0A1I7XT19_HETBA
MMSTLTGIPFAILFVVLTIIGVLGNLVVIIAISGDSKMRRSVMNILLLNLAIADLSNLLLTTCEWVPPVFAGTGAWSLPEALCPICRYLECLFLFASISTQLIVCVERYIATVLPMQARRLCSRQNAVLTVIIGWIFCAIFSAPYAYTHYVKQSCRNCPKEGKKNDTLRTRRNVVKMLIACVTIYFLCYSPIQAIFLSKAVFNISIHPPYEFLLLMNALAMTCSASNPLVYTLFSLKFRRRLQAVLACRRIILSRRRAEIKEAGSKQTFSNVHSTGGSL